LEPRNFLNIEKHRAGGEVGRCDPRSPRSGIPLGSGSTTIKRQKAFVVALFARLRLRPPSCGNTRFIEPQKRSAEARTHARARARLRRARCRFCAARTMASAAQLRLDVLTVFPNTLLRFYTGRARETTGPLSRIRLTCDICSASETSRRERRDCAFLSDARRVEDSNPYSWRTFSTERVCVNSISRSHSAQSSYWISIIRNPSIKSFGDNHCPIFILKH